MPAHAQSAEEQLPLTTSEPDQGEHAARIARELSFATDEQLAAWLRPVEVRLTVVENGLANFKAAVPAMERECAAIRQNLTAVLDQLDRAA